MDDRHTIQFRATEQDRELLARLQERTGLSKSSVLRLALRRLEAELGRADKTGE